MNYDAVVFDMDGVLLERTPAHVFDDAVDRTLSTNDLLELPEEEYQRIRSITTDSRTDFVAFSEKHGIDPEKLYATRANVIADGQKRVVENGEKALFEDSAVLDSLSVEMGIVSNNQQEMVDWIVDYFGWDARLAQWSGMETTLEAFDRKKPNPVSLTDMLETLGARTAIYVGDRESDIVTARRAGVDSALIERSYNEHLVFEEQPTYTLESLHELEDLVDGSPRRTVTE